MTYKLLLAQCYKKIYEDTQYRLPSKYKEYLTREYPSIEKWAKPEIFETLEDWPNDVLLILEKTARNNAGLFLQKNISTQCKLLHEPATPENLLSELEKDEYTHVGLGVHVASYDTFLKCSKAIREQYPEIIIIAGNVGIMFKDTEKYTDLICRGRGVPFLRKLFNEDINAPYKLGMVETNLKLRYKDQMIERHFVEYTTKLGCPHKCDFCITNKFFDGKFSGILVSPEEVRDSLVDHKKTLGNKDFTVYFAEPTAITDHKWFYELFDLFEDEQGCYPIYMPTTASSLKNFNVERTLNSALRLETVAIGIESFEKNYRKNQQVNIVELIKHLREYGIGVYASHIIGFPNQTEDDIWREIYRLLTLNALAYEIHNIKVLPETPLWNELKSKGKLLELQNDFYYIKGFQSFKHDHFKAGFEDIYPLMYRIRYYIEQECGNIAISLYNLMKNIVEKKTRHWRLFRRNMKLYQTIAREIFPAWKRFFKPSEEQIQRYIKRIE